MKPTRDGAQPRRDGWFEHDGTWEEVTVGTVLADRDGSRTKRWEVIDVSHGLGVKYGYTLFMRVREQTSGEEFTIQPQWKVGPVVILTGDPADTKTAAPTEPSDSEAIMTLVRELGAEILAHKDDTTGEIVCPDYGQTSHEGEPHRLNGKILHMRVAHGLSVDDDITVEEGYRLHAEAHANPTGLGFPHRHVPEMLDMFR